jgi:glycosyltransferase involved in cell wall biosynthesis
VTGLGASARLCFETLRAAGRDPIAVDLTGPLMQRKDLPIPESPPAQEGPGVLILHVNGPLVPLALLALGRQFVRGKRIVGYWHWELERLPADWTSGFSRVHEVWVPSAFVKGAIESRAKIPVQVLPHPIAVSALERPSSDGIFRVLTLFDMASSVERKNPLASVAAFRQAFGNDTAAQMTLKVTNPDSHSDGMVRLRAAIGGAPNISVMTDVLSEDALLALIARSDVLLSLHRAEGFGLPLAQAMAQGRVVVATGWSSTTEFMSPDASCMIPFRLNPVDDPQHTYNLEGARWADADIPAAAAWLRRLADDEALRADIGRRARALMAERFSPQCYVDGMDRILSL